MKNKKKTKQDVIFIIPIKNRIDLIQSNHLCGGEIPGTHPEIRGKRKRSEKFDREDG